MLSIPRREGPPTTGGSSSLPPLVQALLRPTAYPHPAQDLRLYETHISWIVLAGPYAYKIKKPVDFGFLDFSTVERRRAVCADEVRLNRRLCPDVYLGVVDVVERDGQYFLDGPGRPVEPAVWMRRLPAEGMLPNLLARDAVGPRLVRRIARRVARFHGEAATGSGVDEYGSVSTIRGNWVENFAQAAPFPQDMLPILLRQEIRRYVERFMAQHGDLLERRVASERIREGHGDLHAASICVEGRRLQLFDCLEFNPRFRCADVAAEVAFLAMDLDHYGRADLGTAFVDEYVRASGDVEAPMLLDFYKCYRAFVRAKVQGLRLLEGGLSPERAGEVARNARAYFDLAWAYAGGLGRPTLVVVMGLPASGKTTLARALAGRLGLVHLSSDVIRKQLAGLEPTTRRTEAFGTGLYASVMSGRTYTALRRRAAHWLRRGRSVVLDATHGRPTERRAIRQLADRLGAHAVFLVCRADEGTIRERLGARATDGHTASDARLEIWPALRAAFVEPAELSEAMSIDTSGSLEDAVRRAVTRLRQARGGEPAAASVVGERIPAAVRRSG
jgi:aminoglycoside phosphotransferase family enzyme/predicted kinase